MLKMHDFECVACGYTHEELLDAPPELLSIHCPKCRGVCKHVIIGGKSFTFEPFTHPHLGHEPVLIKSWGHYRKVLRERGLENPLGS